MLIAALDAASAADIVEALPDGLDTLIAERGREFSGGQQQRLRLARALLADPPILVLVEPTSAVDAHTEARIASRLRCGPGRPDDRGRDAPARWCSTGRPRALRGGRQGGRRGHAPRAADAEPRYAGRPVTQGGSRERAEDPAGRRDPGGPALRAAADAPPPAPPRAGARPARARRRRRPGDAAAARQPGREDPAGHHRRRGRPGRARHRRLRGRAVGADPVRRSTPRRASASRCSPSCARSSCAGSLDIPLSTVERAGTGDLLTRTSRDVNALSLQRAVGGAGDADRHRHRRCSPSARSSWSRRCSRCRA